MAGARGLFGMQDKGWTDASGLAMEGLKIQEQAEAAKTKKQVTTQTAKGGGGGAGGGVGAGIGSAIGGIAGSYFGPLGTMAGSAIGGAIGGAIDGGGSGAASGGLSGLASGISMNATGADTQIQGQISSGWDSLKNSLGMGIANQNSANKSLLDNSSKSAFNNFYKGNSGSVF